MLSIFIIQGNLLAGNLLPGNIFTKDRALLNAVKHGNTERVRTLIDEGADVNAVNQYGISILMQATRKTHPNLEIINLLIDKGADVDAIDLWKQSVLINTISTIHPNPEVINLLIDRGASVNTIDQHGNSVLINAVLTVFPNPEVINLLIDRGANVNTIDRHGNSVLIKAVSTVLSNPEIINLLIDRGADIDAIDQYGNTASYYAREKRILSPNATFAEWYKYSTRNETGDFTIYAGNNEIKAHKDILAARSNLYRDMFEIATNNNNNSVNYYGNLSLPALNAIIEFMYKGRISNLTQEIAQELLDKFAGEVFMLPEGELEEYLRR